MITQREAGFEVPFHSNPESFKFAKEDLVVASEVQRVDSPQESGLTLIRHRLTVKTPGSMIDYNSSLAVIAKGQASLSRAVAVTFGQDYPRPEGERAVTLPIGEFQVSLTDVHRGRQQDGIVSFGERNDPRLRISLVRDDVYTPYTAPVTVNRGGNEYEVFEMRLAGDRSEEVLYDSDGIVISNGGREPVEHREMSPHPLHSEKIVAALRAASQFASLARVAVAEQAPSVRLGDISDFTGPYREPVGNLLDAFTLKPSI